MLLDSFISFKKKFIEPSVHISKKKKKIRAAKLRNGRNVKVFNVAHRVGNFYLNF